MTAAVRLLRGVPLRPSFLPVAPAAARFFSSTATTRRSSWPHDKLSPPGFGRYAVLDAAGAMEVYPPPRPVPEGIARPAYVPSNYFTAPIWEHEAGGEEVGPDGIRLGTEEERGVREAGRIAGEVLKAVRGIVSVSTKQAGGFDEF